MKLADLQEARLALDHRERGVASVVVSRDRVDLPVAGHLAATGRSTFGESPNTGKKDIAVQKVANISNVAVVALCVPTRSKGEPPWAR